MSVKVNKPGRSPKLGRPSAPSLSVAFKSALVRFAEAPMGIGTGGTVIEYDAVTASLMPNDGYAYQGYLDGTFANMDAVRADHPGKVYESVTPDGDAAADELDIEPGDATVMDAPAFYRAKGGKNVKFYTSAGNAQALINELSVHGIPRSAYKIRSAHWIGRHICAPTGCGYPSVEACQYASNSWYDTSLCLPAYFGAVTPAFPLQEGESGQVILQLQDMLNKWRSVTGSVLLAPDGVFGPVTKTAVQVALKHWNYDSAKVAAGQCDQSLWDHLAGVVPPPSDWTYGPPVSLRVRAGHTSFKASWQPPVLKPSEPFPAEYVMYVYEGKAPNHTNIVPTYPRVVTGMSKQFGGLKRRTLYTAHLVAAGPHETRVARDVFAKVVFTTG